MVSEFVSQHFSFHSLSRSQMIGTFLFYFFLSVYPVIRSLRHARQMAHRVRTLESLNQLEKLLEFPEGFEVRSAASLCFNRSHVLLCDFKIKI